VKPRAKRSNNCNWCIYLCYRAGKYICVKPNSRIDSYDPSLVTERQHKLQNEDFRKRYKRCSKPRIN